MTFHSILYIKPRQFGRDETSAPPPFFGDLNLDQIVTAITAGGQLYNLDPFFYAPLDNLEEIEYRHEVMRDLENQPLLVAVKSFAQQMRTMRDFLEQANKLRFRYQKQRWFLDGVKVYCHAVNALVDDLRRTVPKSRGFVALLDYLTTYKASDTFAALVTSVNRLEADLAAIRYCLLVKGNSVKVRHYGDEDDYSAEVLATFAKFQQSAPKDYRVRFSGGPGMSHVEETILGFVARLYPEVFAALDNFYTKNQAYFDPTIAAFDREVQFYVAYLDYMARFKAWGLSFCYPQVSDTSKEISVHDGFDLALAQKLMNENSLIVCNDFYLEGRERIFVVSGPNQGGKTTFARTFGQMHYLASLGLPVPGRDARLFLCDRILTHFEQEEDITNLRGKLQDDLVRIYDILHQATPRSIIIMNEIFTSTTIEDAIFLGKAVVERIIALDCLCVCVTFVDELTALDKTVSMVSTVASENLHLRTFKIVRKPADGLSYALTIAEKYRLTYPTLRERLRT